MTTDADRISTAWQMLGHLGITLADLQATVERRPIMPTFADYLPRVAAAASPGTHRTYGTYWQRMEAVWGDRRLDDIVATDIEARLQSPTHASQQLPTHEQTLVDDLSYPDRGCRHCHGAAGVDRIVPGRA